MDCALLRNHLDFAGAGLVRMPLEHRMESYGHLHEGCSPGSEVPRMIANHHQATRVEDAKQIQVMPIANSGSPDICDLIHDKVEALPSEPSQDANPLVDR